MDCVHYFNGAGKKGRPFRGWAGRVTEWAEKSAPIVEFGAWNPDNGSPYNGGTVIFDCQPLDLVMYGANSAKMDSRDKTTKFGFAGLGVGGVLRIADLPRDSEARQIFSAEGCLPPSPEEIVGRLLSCMQDGATTSIGLNEEIKAVRVKTIEAFGIHDHQFDETLAGWPILSPILHALASAAELLAEKRSAGATARLRQAKIDVAGAVNALRGTGEELTNTSIAAYLLKDKSGQSNYHVKEKVRSLKKLLGDEFFRVEQEK